MPKIHFKGVDYNHPQDMPSDIRAEYDQAVRELPDRDVNGIPDLLESDGSLETSPLPLKITKSNQPLPVVLKPSTEGKKLVRWIVLITLGVISIIVAFTVLIFMLIFGMMKSSEAYHLGMDAAWVNPTVQEVLGAPLSEGLFVTGSISDSGPSGSAEINVPLSGSRQSGTLTVIASKEENTWRLDSLYLETGGQTYQIH